MIRVLAFVLLLWIGFIHVAVADGGGTLSDIQVLVKPAQDAAALVRQFQMVERDFAHPQKDGERYRSLIEQLRASYLSFVGLYTQALQAHEVGSSAALEMLPTSSGFHQANAADAVKILAANNQVLFFNEAHHDARGRAFLLGVLPTLRQLGFRYLALEALDPRDGSLNKRGYATSATGFYTQEPIFADLIRTAIAQGFELVPYEADEAHSDTVPHREQAQAENLFERTVRKNPSAKVLVLAGSEHIALMGEGDWAEPMAARFAKISGIVPVTIDQTTLVPRSDRKLESPAYSKLRPLLVNATRPVMFLNQAGSPWAIDKKYFTGQIVFPDDRVDAFGRPEWLALTGQRVAKKVSLESCRKKFPCLIEVRPDHEPAEAVATDRYLARKATPFAEIYVPDDHAQISFYAGSDPQTQAHE